MTIKNKQNNMKILARRLKIVGDPSRIKILCLIFNNHKMCVSDIAKELKMSIAIVSHHLQFLAKEGLLERSREGKNICYLFTKDNLNLDLKKFICKYK